jgi:hypothetical protein
VLLIRQIYSALRIATTGYPTVATCLFFNSSDLAQRSNTCKTTLLKQYTKSVRSARHHQSRAGGSLVSTDQAGITTRPSGPSPAHPGRLVRQGRRRLHSSFTLHCSSIVAKIKLHPVCSVNEERCWLFFEVQGSAAFRQPSANSLRLMDD